MFPSVCNQKQDPETWQLEQTTECYCWGTDWEEDVNPSMALSAHTALVFAVENENPIWKAQWERKCMMNCNSTLLKRSSGNCKKWQHHQCTVWVTMKWLVLLCYPSINGECKHGHNLHPTLPCSIPMFLLTKCRKKHCQDNHRNYDLGEGLRRTVIADH
jgi:hypothetical protein